jgi:stage III sporulation protein AG
MPMADADWWQQWWRQDRKTMVRLIAVGLVGLLLLLWGSLGVGSPGPRARPATGPPEAGTLTTEAQALDQVVTQIVSAIPGAGRVAVAVTLQRSAESAWSHGRRLGDVAPDVQGVVVVATGAANPVVRSEVTEAVETLLQVAPYQVLVLPDGGGIASSPAP